MKKTMNTGLSMANINVSRNFRKGFDVPLSPGDLFIMSPGVIHAVINKGDSFANGSLSDIDLMKLTLVSS